MSDLTTHTSFVREIATLLETARAKASRAVHSVLVATYWEIGRRIVEEEQGGEKRADYGEKLLERLSADLSARFGRGFSVDNLETMRLFYLAFAGDQISETASRKFPFSLSWSHYVLLIRRTNSKEARGNV